MELQNPLVAENAAANPAARLHAFRPAQHVEVASAVRQLQAVFLREVLRIADAHGRARRHRHHEVHVEARAFAHQLVEQRRFILVRLLQGGVVVDDNQQIRHCAARCAAVKLDVARIIRQHLSASADFLIQPLDEVLELLILAADNHVADLRQACKEPPGFRRVIKAVDVEHIRPVVLAQRRNHCRNELVFARIGHGVEQNVAVAEVNFQRILPLLRRVVHHANHSFHLLRMDFRRVRFRQPREGNLVRVKRGKPNLRRNDGELFCFFRNVFGHGADLLQPAFVLPAARRLLLQHRTAIIVEDFQRSIRLLAIVRQIRIRRAAPCTLPQHEQLVAAHLQVEAPRVDQRAGFRAAKHLHTVTAILHLQADAEARVADNLLVDDTGRLLRRQNQVDAQAAPDA